MPSFGTDAENSLRFFGSRKLLGNLCAYLIAYAAAFDDVINIIGVFPKRLARKKRLPYLNTR